MIEEVIKSIELAHKSGAEFIVLADGKGWLESVLMHDTIEQIQYVVWPDRARHEWKVQAVPKTMDSLSYRARIHPHVHIHVKNVRRVDSNGVMVGVEDRCRAIEVVAAALMLKKRV